MDRSKLPFRKNCEGYFFNEDGLILAKNTGKGYIGFPGGGVDEGESSEDALVRETFEETGALLDSPLLELGKINFLWDESWVTSEKQKRRFDQFKGEEMYFFSGKIKGFKKIEQEEEDTWSGEMFMSVSDVIDFLESSRPFADNIRPYREAQLKFLKTLL